MQRDRLSFSSGFIMIISSFSSLFVLTGNGEGGQKLGYEKRRLYFILTGHASSFRNQTEVSFRKSSK